MVKKFIRKLIDVEIKLGFLHIPAAGIEMMPDNGQNGSSGDAYLIGIPSTDISISRIRN